MQTLQLGRPAHGLITCRRRQLSLQRTSALSGGTSASGIDDTCPVALPLFVLGNVLHPTQSGVLRVFEPRYLALFKDQQRQQQQQQPQQQPQQQQQQPQQQQQQPQQPPPPQQQQHIIRFGHILSPEAAPPALLEGSVCGLPSVGVLARVTKIEEAEGGSELTVHYEGVRRFKLLAVDQDREPYYLGAVQWYNDDLASQPPQDRAIVDDLERSLMSMLSEVQHLSRRLGVSLPQAPAAAAGAAGVSQQGGQQLPAAVFRYSPPPVARKSTADYLREMGAPAGEAIAMWQRHGSVYGNASVRKESPADPYQHLREQLAKERRQELFSFAAAGCLELGVVERLALLLSQDTGARLSYTCAAVKPYMDGLAAKLAVKGAVGGGPGR